jgi:uncharacterized protein YpuA (DUF1002 family)
MSTTPKQQQQQQEEESRRRAQKIGRAAALLEKAVEALFKESVDAQEIRDAVDGLLQDLEADRSEQEEARLFHSALTARLE